ncbi:general transcription factor IIH subunit 1 [Hetaerina americana]|uniref:general transcription factor IIH subunit 1 n=1 Tax=Hetaerina americana TaxID=62018 RepID=UPI003A7F3DEC
MTASSEDVLLQINHVRYKKSDGTLYVMNERLAWIMENRDTVSVSHLYTEIKLQKISPDGKAKIQLQVVLHDGSASTFHFVNPMGQQGQIKDRDDVKDLLQQLLPKFKRKVNKELEEKNRLLSENPKLLQLYRDLVITQVISSEEFWAQHASQYAQKQNQKQEIGVSGAFLADIKPQTDGCNGLKYNLTADIIESIFKTYPAVRKKHLEYVPHKLSESEFWTKFFQSHYFHRDRIHAGTKDLFTECAKLDDQEIKRDISSGIRDPLVDLSSFEDNTLDEGYGNSAEKPSQNQSGNIVHQNMIKRFNQHSIMVMKACQKNSSISGKIENSASQTNGNCSNEDDSNSLIQHKKLKIREKITYDDLEESTSTITSRLNLSKVERYLHGPLPGSSNVATSDEVVYSQQQFKRELESWNSHKTQLINPATAVNVLGELTPGGILMKGYAQDSLAQMVPPDLEQEIKNLYVSLCELLRHFWACFPPTTPSLEEKAVHMHEALQRFHSARLKVFEDKIIQEYTPLSQQLTSHLNQLLNSAYRKFGIWHQRKLQSIR